MDLLTSFNAYGDDSSSQMRAIFASIFALQNRLQTIGDRLQDGITMKQWLLLAMAEACPEPRTLTDVGALMGCSRQNVKQLAAALERKGLVSLAHGPNNAVGVKLTPAAHAYMDRMAPVQAAALETLFRDLDNEEVGALFRAFGKLHEGAGRMERFAAGRPE